MDRHPVALSHPTTGTEGFCASKRVMRTIVHLSDLHFGRIDPAILEPAIGFVRDLRPNVVAVSGDLTQRARTAEYFAARDFLRALPSPQIVVPGNHDVPLHNLFSRFGRTLDRYRRYITNDLAPFYCDEEIAIAGANTAPAFSSQKGPNNPPPPSAFPPRF